MKTVLYLTAFMAIIVGAVIYPPHRNVFSLITYGLVVLGGLFVLVNWHAYIFTIRCVVSKHISEISAWKDLASPHGVNKKGGWKCLNCRDSGRWMKARILP
jgi:hypothetical protein